MLKNHRKNKRRRIFQNIMKEIQKLFKSISLKENQRSMKKKEYADSIMQIYLDQSSYAAVVVEDFTRMGLQK